MAGASTRSNRHSAAMHKRLLSVDDVIFILRTSVKVCGIVSGEFPAKWAIAMQSEKRRSDPGSGTLRTLSARTCQISRKVLPPGRLRIGKERAAAPETPYDCL